jgi:putative spermidine/putrescine transport system permease protein
VLVGGGQVVTLPVLLFAFAQSGDLPLTAALSLVFVAPALGLIAFTARALSNHTAVAGMGKL